MIGDLEQQVAQAAARVPAPEFDLQSVDWWVYAANAVLGTWLLAVLFPLPLQFFGTHYLKFRLPADMDDEFRSLLIQFLAVLIYMIQFVPSFCLFQGFTLRNVGLAIGLGMVFGWILPIAYKGYMRRKYVKRPELVEKFSADHRARQIRAWRDEVGALHVKAGNDPTQIIKPNDIGGGAP